MRTHKLKIVSAIALLMLPAFSQAAENTPAESSFNPVLIGLVSLLVILLFAIGVLGNALRQLLMVYRDKMRSQKSKGIAGKTLGLLLMLFLSSLPAMAQEAAAEVAAAPASPYISGIPKNDFYLLMGVIGLELLIVFALLINIRLLIRLISNKPEVVKAPKKAHKPFWDRFNKAVAVEKEEDIVLDHDYDGIKELDNSLPPWWKWGFVFTIIISVVYMWYYHMGGNGPSSYEEYAAQVEEGERQKAAYLAQASNNVDENTVTMLDAGGITAGRSLYEMNCAACHAKDGGGGVGPNLADDYWLHGGHIKDVFKSIKYGWADKGMKSWKDDFSPKQIAEISSYVKSLRGTTPAAPKEPQGEQYVEQQEAPDKATDTASNRPIAENLAATAE